MMIEESANEVLMSPVQYTSITDPELLKLPLYKLDDLFLRFDEIPQEQRT